MSTDRPVTVGRVEALWRYPVKSTLGELLGRVAVDEGDVEGGQLSPGDEVLLER